MDDKSFFVYSTQNRIPLHFSTISIVNIPIYASRWRKKLIMFCPFWMSLIDNTHRTCSSVVNSTFRKKTYTGLLTNYFSFKSLSYNIGLIRTLIDRVFKINNTWLGFHKDIAKLVFILRKNLFPVHLIDKCVYRYLNTAIDRYGSNPTAPSCNITSLANRYCNDLDIRLVFTTFKLRNIFSVKSRILSLENSVHV